MLVFLTIAAAAQEPEAPPDSLRLPLMLQRFANDSLANDSLPNDSLPLASPSDTLRKKSSMLDKKVDYKAADSITFNLKTKKAVLYQSGEIVRENTTIHADYIEIDFTTKQLYARGVKDSLETVRGSPDFKDGDKSFRSKEITYNFDSRKALILDVITQEGEGFLHGERVKKHTDDKTDILHGQYTTCDLDHPHFQIQFKKARVIPNDKIVTGPAYLVLHDIPTPLIVPFGFFPNRKGQQNGILIPSYGETANRGFFLENGGYYWGFSEYADLALRGDIYSRGSWAVKVASNYVKRYKFTGTVNVNYAENFVGEKDLPGYLESKDFFVTWNHQQSPQAHPTRRFSANVNAGTSDYNNFNPSTSQNYLSSSFQSNISYSTSIGGFSNFSANLRHSQNKTNRSFELTLPEIAWSVNRFYPLRAKGKSSNLKWYDNISMSYNMNARNNLRTSDTLSLAEMLNGEFTNGVRHSIPITSTVKLLKHFSWNNTLSYDEKWYGNTINRQWDNGMLIRENDTIYGYLRTDTIRGFSAAREFSYTSSVSTKLYGMYTLTRGPVKAVRHVLTPGMSFSWRPDYGEPRWGYYKYYLDNRSPVPVAYSIFSTGIYGGPGSGKSGLLNFSLSNNVELKVKSKKDTINGEKKIVLIENLSLGTSYNLAKDSLRWSALTLSGNTRLFQRLDIRYAAYFDPYAINPLTGVNINRFEYEESGKLFRRTNSEWALAFSYSLVSKKSSSLPKASEKASEEEIADINRNLNQFVDFNNPYNLYLDYTLRYTSVYDFSQDKFKRDTIQSIGLRGDVNITDKWKVGFMTNYDFKQKDFGYTSIDFYRDLHCWELHLNWIPTGFRKSYNLTIKVKSPVLQDLKLTRKKDWLD